MESYNAGLNSAIPLGLNNLLSITTNMWGPSGLEGLGGSLESFIVVTIRDRSPH